MPVDVVGVLNGQGRQTGGLPGSVGRIEQIELAPELLERRLSLATSRAKTRAKYAITKAFVRNVLNQSPSVRFIKSLLLIEIVDCFSFSAIASI